MRREKLDKVCLQKAFVIAVLLTIDVTDFVVILLPKRGLYAHRPLVVREVH